MSMQVDKFPVVDSGTSNRAGVDAESESAHQVQRGLGSHARSRHGARVGWNLRLDQHDAQWVGKRVHAQLRRFGHAQRVAPKG